MGDWQTGRDNFPGNNNTGDAGVREGKVEKKSDFHLKCVPFC